MRVLLVEDETLVRRFIRTLINWEESGYRIVGEAANGEEAWKLLQNHDVDIVLTDIRMPLLDGFGLIQRIAEAGIPCEVAILSSYDDFDYVRTALKLQVSDYVHKATMSSAELLACLDKAKTDWIKRQEHRLVTNWTGDSEENRKRVVRASLLTMALVDQEEFQQSLMLGKQLNCWQTPFYAGIGIPLSEQSASECAARDTKMTELTLFEYDHVWVAAGESEISGCGVAAGLETFVSVNQPISLMEWPAAYERLRSELAVQLENRHIPLAYHELVRKAIGYMLECYMNELTLETVSAYVHISPSYFSRLFQKETGTSFTEYLTALRLQRAKQILQSSDYPVYEIAERVGYRNPRYFLKLFKELHGMTPTEFRVKDNRLDE